MKGVLKSFLMVYEEALLGNDFRTRGSSVRMSLRLSKSRQEWLMG